MAEDFAAVGAAYTDEDNNRTIGNYLWGLKSDEEQARFTESLYREAEEFQELGELPEGLTYSAIAEGIIDTLAGYTATGPIPATELVGFLRDVFEQF